MPRKHRHSPLPGRGLAALWRAREGITALEFGLIAPVLLTIVLLIVESGLLLFTQAALDHAAQDASRLIRTGQVQLAGNSATPFTNQLCSDLSHLLACSAIQVRVQSASSFASLDHTIPVTSSGAMQNPGFVPGGPGQDVLVQVGYQPSYLIPLVGSMLGAEFGQLLVSSVSFQNENY